MFAFWQSFDPRFLIFFACSLALTETMVYVGWRMSVRCDSCAFDPVLYRNNPAKAAEQVKLHLDDLRTTGKYLLKKNNPFAHLEVQKKPPAEQPGPRGKPEHGQILSRQI